MSRVVATIERVREACNELLENGGTLSAANVIKLVGGSKQTVLRHLEIVRVELAEGPRADDGPSAFLHELADPLLRKLWASAQEQAALNYQRQLRVTTSIQEGLFEDIAVLRASEEALQDKLVAAEEKIAAQASADERIQALMGMVEEAAGLKAVPSNGSDRHGGAMRVVKILHELGGSASPEEIDAKLRREHGLSGKQALRARQHSMAGDLVAMSLTETGRAQLQTWEENSTAQAELAL